jgi:transcriptional regulator of arginine metabolism
MSKQEPVNDVQERLAALRQIIRTGEASTQEGLCQALRAKKYDVTQSTVSRDLRRIGAVKTSGADGEINFHLPDELQNLQPRLTLDLRGLVTEIQSNESMIVLHTSPGSASLIARHLDGVRADLGVLGTIAGDDAIFVVPASVKKIPSIIKNIQKELK